VTAPIRPAGPADDAEVIRLRLAAYGALRDRYASDREFDAHMAELSEARPPGAEVLITDGGTIALFGEHIRFLAVDPAVQRGGLGRRLVTSAVERGARSLQTATWMTEARRLYESMGFRLVRENTETYGNLELVWYELAAPPR
jgi:GNAT superfamily N-acetyltransferase